MKKALCVLAAVILLGILGLTAVHVNRQHAQSLWLNYAVNDSGMILLARPDLPPSRQSSVVLLSFMQLPGACLNDLDAQDWEPGTSGSIAFNKDWCRVDRYAVFEEAAAKEHYRQLKVWLQRRNR